MKAILAILFITALGSQTYAQSSDAIFTDLDFNQQDFSDMSKDLTGAFSFTTNSSASSLGSLWGFEVGLVAGITPADNIKRIAEEMSGDAQDELKYLPSGGLIGGVALPFGIGVELNLIPKLDFGDVSFSNTQIAARWEITNMIPIVGAFSPLKLALRLSHGNTGFDYSSGEESAEISLKSNEIAALASVNLILIEPYLSVSHVKSTGDLDAESKNPLFPLTRSFDSSFKGTKLTTGLLFKLALIRFGLEYSTLNDIERYTAKLSFKI